MAKRPTPGDCIHCGERFDELTWDHVFPRAWYPENTPEGLEKWKVPSCERCNAEYGALEQDLLLRMGMCLGPEDSEAAGIPQKALRTIKPEFAKAERDRLARQKARETVKAEIEWTDELNTEGLLPGFGPRPYFEYSQYAAVKISAESLRRMGVKLAKGLTYVLRGKTIPPDYEIEIIFPGGPDAAQVAPQFERAARTENRGPGLTVAHTWAHDDPVAALFKITVWGRLVLYAAVLPRETANEAERAV